MIEKYKIGTHSRNLTVFLADLQWTSSFHKHRQQKTVYHHVVETHAEHQQKISIEDNTLFVCPGLQLCLCGE